MVHVCNTENSWLLLLGNQRQGKLEQSVLKQKINRVGTTQVGLLVYHLNLLRSIKTASLYVGLWDLRFSVL